jgi:GNAT superfamily N-acetyltransferase
MLIRPATPADIPLILSLIRELADYEKAPDQACATPALLSRALFPSAPDSHHAECLIGELDGSPQGFALFFTNFSTWTGRPGIYLEDLFVRPAARGKGLGKALLTRLAAIAHSRGCARLEWAVLDWNTPAIDFYKALGATPMEEWTTFRVTGEALKRLSQAAG